ncbi:hypothetical protein EIN_080760 [Entamoeba invadens IP1]|uniref:hypothetical protein n=1 Tax=Entamoeba invadens IP1 TaxID=370355 RepID=UPI0002C3E726|nr:hypothetical protein EIN_080760 [Entamoeba invadens IP1]ELP85104.1 hypothetical protein EIN_080760 [Entamoeba invadens IP1]|eukprot:XP_004184450.1 hypothetical protein EIN_080760 [Entamoeba invadens IP1]
MKVVTSEATSDTIREEYEWYINTLKPEIKTTQEKLGQIKTLISPTKETINEECLRFDLDGFQGMVQLNGTECSGSRIVINNEEWSHKPEAFYIVDCPLKQMYNVLYVIGTIEDDISLLDPFKINDYIELVTKIYDMIGEALDSIRNRPTLIFPFTPTHTFFMRAHPTVTADIYIEHSEIVVKIFKLDSVGSKNPSPSINDGDVNESVEVKTRQRTAQAFLIESRYYWVENVEEIHLTCQKLDEIVNILSELQEMWGLIENNVTQFAS